MLLLYVSLLLHCIDNLYYMGLTHWLDLDYFDVSHGTSFFQPRTGWVATLKIALSRHE